MKLYTFYTIKGVFTAVKSTMKEAFTDVCINNKGLGPADVRSGTISAITHPNMVADLRLAA